VLNTDDKANAKIVGKFEMNAQALYLVSFVNGKEIKTDLTEFAFFYLSGQPGKIQGSIKTGDSRCSKVILVDLFNFSGNNISKNKFLIQNYCV
jgi:hypothetical protein